MLVEVEIKYLKPHPSNYRKHPPEQVEKIERSIKTFGIVKNIVISEDYYILAGHGVVEACRNIGIEKVKAYVIPYPHTSPVAKAFLVADNEIQKMGIDDTSLLVELLSSIKQEDENAFYTTGYDDVLLELLRRQTWDRYWDKEGEELEGFEELGESIKKYRIIFSFYSREKQASFLREIEPLAKKYGLRRFINDSISNTTINFAEEENE
ncbi:MAG: ParB N-terminal domain-containing protein [Brevinematia bacterium]